jgi:hypothetical protein
VKLGVGKKEERWKMYVLGALVLGGVYAAYTNLAPASGSGSSSSNPAARVAPPVAPPTGQDTPAPVRRQINGRVAGDFRPKLRDARPENRPDPAKIDPTIKLGLLAKVQNVTMDGGARNIFQFGQAVPLTEASAGTTIPKVKQIIPTNQVSGTQKPPDLGPPPPPPAPPIPFKYYGYSAVKGETRKRAFFLDGDDIIVAWEGDLIKNRYKVVHIGLRSVEMEDTQFKNNKQSLPLAEEAAG